jgi:hypothetical protein
MHPVFAIVEMYSQRLRKPAHDIKNQRQPLFLRSVFLIVITIFYFPSLTAKRNFSILSVYETLMWST